MYCFEGETEAASQKKKEKKKKQEAPPSGKIIDRLVVAQTLTSSPQAFFSNAVEGSWICFVPKRDTAWLKKTRCLRRGGAVVRA